MYCLPLALPSSAKRKRVMFPLNDADFVRHTSTLLFVPSNTTYLTDSNPIMSSVESKFLHVYT